MRAVVCRRFGLPGDLTVEEMPHAAVLRPGELRVAVAASGVNPADVMQVAGTHQNTPPPPFTPGFECAGTVSELGPGVEGLRPGARVAVATSFGAHAEEVVADARHMAVLPDHAPPQAAATVPVRFGTALLALRHRAGLAPGEAVLVTGAGGKVGSAAVQVALRLGARVVIAAVRDDAEAATARRLGADPVAVPPPDLPAAVRGLTGGRGADVVFDTVNGPLFAPALDALAPQGRFLPVGVGSGQVETLSSMEVLVRMVALVGVDWDWTLRNDPDTTRDVLATVVGWWTGGTLDTGAVHERPLADAARVLAELAAGRLTASTVLVP